MCRDFSTCYIDINHISFIYLYVIHSEKFSWISTSIFLFREEETKSKWLIVFFKISLEATNLHSHIFSLSCFVSKYVFFCF